MGQVALGFRSLLIKLAIFFVMAVLLAWALGGTLWPRAETVDLPGVTFEGRAWFWRLTAGGRSEAIQWTLMARGEDEEPEPVDDRVWQRVIPVMHTADALYYAGSSSLDEGAAWQIERIGVDGVRSSHRVPDGLAAERQLARLRHGFDLQDGPTIERLRPIVLDPSAPASAGGASGGGAGSSAGANAGADLDS